jgi:pimeloyl-ACP methyl ester carboxylesterase
MVLLHGFTDSSFSFSRLLPLLDPARVRAFAIDQRGHGDSERPSSDYTVDTMAGDVGRFLDAVGIAQATVVGHSMGSLVARRFAELAPERVASLVLIGSSYTFATDATIEFRAAVGGLEDPVPEAFAREFQAGTGHVPLPEEFFERVVTDSLKVPARVWKDALDGVLDFDDTGDLGAIASPTLILSGRLDPYFGADQQHRLAAAIPGARLIEYPDTAHNAHWERPQSVAYDVAAFLRETSGRLAASVRR